MSDSFCLDPLRSITGNPEFTKRGRSYSSTDHFGGSSRYKDGTQREGKRGKPSYSIKGGYKREYQTKFSVEKL